MIFSVMLGKVSKKHVEMLAGGGGPLKGCTPHMGLSPPLEFQGTLFYSDLANSSDPRILLWGLHYRFFVKYPNDKPRPIIL